MSRVAALVIFALAVACTRAPALATLDGQPLGEADFQRHLASLFPDEEAQRIRQDPTRRGGELESWFDTLVLSAKARRQGLDAEPRFRKAIELMEMRTLARLLTEQHRTRIESITRVTPNEVRRFYEDHKADYPSTPGFTARQVLVYVLGNPAFPERGLAEPAARAKARQALRQLRAGQGWDAVARRFSDDLSNNQKGGLIREAQFGLFTPEVEQAVRTQPLGQPGDLVRSMFGFHVLQVESRHPAETPRPFEEVEPLIRERLSALHAQQAHQVFVEPMAREMGLRLTQAGQRDVPLLDEGAIAGDEVLATMSARTIRESDFRWFLNDAVPANQRSAVFSRPAARKGWLGTFLDDLVLEAKARKQGMHEHPDFLRQRNAAQSTLLAELVREHDKVGAFCQCQQTPEEQRKAERYHLERVRAEVGLRIVPYVR